MTLFLVLLALMLLGGGLGWLFLNDPGYVLVAWQQTSVELSLSLAFLLLLLAAVAGFFYGRAYVEARSVRAAMVTHALVNTTWRMLFS